ncbi:MAG TPA: UvrD-helicase domain-containing protein [Kiloniellales bacterium]|nr:UvrD-helicase domain-containing protein [Kiloniellales bacterium]
MTESPAVTESLAAEAPPGHPYLAALNPPQREAVEALDGPVLVLAGAGTGKTRVLTTRLAHLLRLGRAAPGQILAVTFTNKAAREMKDRVAGLLGRPVEGWWLGTFHAIGARILRSHAERVGLKPGFTILDPDDQLRLLKQVLEAERLDDRKWPARAILGAIDRWKDRGLTPDKVGASEAGDIAGGRAVAIYEAYQARLSSLNACDFGDLILHCLSLFQDNPEVLAEYHRRFRYLLVDEYQDINVAQYLWLRLLAQGHRNLCCVGDDDQSIYGWRGAEVGNILRFERDFPGAKVIRLEENYRSTGRILAAASALIAHNEGRLGKTLWTRDESGPKLRLRRLWDGETEARFVGEEIVAVQRGGHPLSQIAILVRTSAQTREFEERFMTIGLPYRIVGGARFYERLEIRDALAYLRVLDQPAHDLAFERIVNTPKRGLGEATMRLVHQVARADELSLYAAAERLAETDELRPAARKSLSGLIADFERWRGLIEVMAHPQLAELLLEESGYLAMWQAEKSPDAPGRLENLRELINAMAEFESLAAFLEHVALVMELNEAEDGDKVNVMTLHAAKGLEFDTLFLPGWEEGLFPNQRAVDQGGAKALEEERRLAYVGLTRARRQVILSCADNRRLHGSWTPAIPSRFLEELPREHVETESDPGLYGAATATAGGLSERAADTAWGAGYRTPGMARARQRLAAAGRFAASEPGRAGSRSSDGFAQGARVFHQKFGYGTVAAVAGNRLEVAFDKAGTKKVIDQFLVPAEQAGSWA